MVSTKEREEFYFLTTWIFAPLYFVSEFQKKDPLIPSKT